MEEQTESRFCLDCRQWKPLTSFPLSYRNGRKYRGQKRCCLCKKNRFRAADSARWSKQRKRERYTATAHKLGLTLEQHQYQKAKAAVLRMVKKCRHRQCPVLKAHPKIEYRIRRSYYLEKSKRWHKRNPAKALIKKQRRRARMASVESSLTLTEWEGILKRFGYRCAYCKATSTKLTQDHITPISMGGPHAVPNVVPACGTCNASKNVGPPPTPVQPLMFA
jgi:hypothetical protein